MPVPMAAAIMANMAAFMVVLGGWGWESGGES